MTCRSAVFAAASVLFAAAGLAASPASASSADAPSPEACAIVRATLAQQNAAAAPAAANKADGGRKLLGFAASALRNANPSMMGGRGDNPLKAVAAQAALTALQRAAEPPAPGETPAAAARSGSDDQHLQQFGAVMGGMGPQGARAQAQIEAVRSAARASHGDPRAVQEAVLAQSGC